MKTTKVFLSSFALAGLLAACTNEEFTEPVQKGDALAGRTQVNLTLDAAAGTRMGINGAGIPVFTQNDVLGAVLVDGGYVSEDVTQTDGEIFFNNVKWNVIDGHVGNNKWAYDDTAGKFKTEGTTAVGAWLFYTKYNKKMTTTRNGVEFDFPQIQEGATTLGQAENNNINFKITPILYVDGYEGETMDLVLQYASVFSYLNIKLDFESKLGVTKVQKIVVSAKDENDDLVNFPTKYRIKNTNVPVAKLSLNPDAPEAVKAVNLNKDLVVDKADQDLAIYHAYNKIRYSTNTEKGGNFAWTNVESFEYKNVTETRDENASVQNLVLDCNSNHSDTSEDGSLKVGEDGKFSVYMLMPTGIYKSITLDIYTDKGVYTKEVDDRDEYVVNRSTNNSPVKSGYIFLRPGMTVSLADVEGMAKDENVSDYLPIIENDKKVSGIQYITKTADLINFISVITTVGNHDVNVLNQEQIGGTDAADDPAIAAHNVVINQEVMDAIEAKEGELGGDIQLTFIGAQMKIKGNQAESQRLDIHDLTFNDGCEVTEGFVKTTADIVIPENSDNKKQTMYVKSGADVEFGHVNEDYEKGKVVTRIEVLEGGRIAVAESKSITITGIANKGTIVVNGELVVNALNNEADVTNNGTVNVKSGYNKGSVSNTGSWNVKGVYTNEKLGEKQVVMNNSGIVLVSGGTENDKAALKNSATINNSGTMYCHNGYNTIDNVGLINVTGEGSSTYITTNSKNDEMQDGTNSAEMGVMTIESRDQDISVTTEKKKGYIKYVVKTEDLDNENTLKWIDGDKYNQVVLSSPAVVLDASLQGKLRYVIDNECSKLKLAENLNLQEITFNTNATLNTTNSKVAKLTVAGGKTVKVPTEKVLYVVEVITGQASKTAAKFENSGTILVGGDLYTSVSSAVEANQSGVFDGIFAAGDGNATAFHWGKESEENR